MCRGVRPKLLFIGAFPPPGRSVFGGNVTDCKALLEAGLEQHFDLILVDSTSATGSARHFGQRLGQALRRIWLYVLHLVRRRPDAILMFSSAGLSFVEKSLLMVVGKLGGSTVLFFPRGGKLMDDCRNSKLFRWFARRTMMFADILLCQGETWRRFFVDELGCLPERCRILENWTATPPLLDIGETRQYSAHEQRILFLGSLDQGKGVIDLIEAMAVLRSEVPSVKLLLAGEGGLSIWAREYVEQKGLGAAIKFLGWIDGAARLQAIAEATVFCLPSHVEGLPNAVIEAMGAGLPVVVTPVGCVLDVIRDRENGLVVPVHDREALAAALRELAENGNLRAKLGRTAYEEAKQYYSPSQALSQLVQLVNEYRAL